MRPAGESRADCIHLTCLLPKRQPTNRSCSQTTRLLVVRHDPIDPLRVVGDSHLIRHLSVNTASETRHDLETPSFALARKSQRKKGYQCRTIDMRVPSARVEITKASAYRKPSKFHSLHHFGRLLLELPQPLKRGRDLGGCFGDRPSKLRLSRRRQSRRWARNRNRRYGAAAESNRCRDCTKTLPSLFEIHCISSSASRLGVSDFLCV